MATSRGPDRFIVGGLISAILGLGGVISAAVTFSSNLQADRARTATGTAVITNVFNVPSRSGPSCGLAFEFSVNGHTYSRNSGSANGSEFCGVPIDRRTVVHYNPANPYDSTIDEVRNHNGYVSAVTGSLSGIVAVTGIGVLIGWVVSTRRSRAPTPVEPTPVNTEPDGIVPSGQDTSEWTAYPRPGSEAGDLE